MCKWIIDNCVDILSLLVAIFSFFYSMYANRKSKAAEEEVNSIKYEMFIFDGFEKAESAMIFRVKREEEFAPIKYKEGEDSPQTASKMYEAYWKQNN